MLPMNVSNADVCLLLENILARLMATVDANDDTHSDDHLEHNDGADKQVEV